MAKLIVGLATTSSHKLITSSPRTHATHCERMCAHHAHTHGGQLAAAQEAAAAVCARPSPHRNAHIEQHGCAYSGSARSGSVWCARGVCTRARPPPPPPPPPPSLAVAFAASSPPSPPSPSSPLPALSLARRRRPCPCPCPRLAPTPSSSPLRTREHATEKRSAASGWGGCGGGAGGTRVGAGAHTMLTVEELEEVGRGQKYALRRPTR